LLVRESGNSVIGDVWEGTLAAVRVDAEKISVESGLRLKLFASWGSQEVLLIPAQLRERWHFAVHGRLWHI